MMEASFNHFAEIADNLDTSLQDVALSVATKGASYASRLAPKRTGFLAGSIYVDTSDRHTATVVVGAPYGPFVEEGTRYMSPHPFLGPGMAQAQSEFEEELSSIEGRLGAGL